MQCSTRVRGHASFFLVCCWLYFFLDSFDWLIFVCLCGVLFDIQVFNDAKLFLFVAYTTTWPCDPSLHLRQNHEYGIQVYQICLLKWFRKQNLFSQKHQNQSGVAKHIYYMAAKKYINIFLLICLPTGKRHSSLNRYIDSTTGLALGKRFSSLYHILVNTR